MAKSNTAVVEPVEETVTPEEVIDLTQFEAAVAAAVEGADEATGQPSEALVSAVKDSYQALPGIKAKNAAKNDLSEQLKQYVGSGNITGARTVMILTEEAAVAGKSSAPKKEVNHREAYVSKVATLTLALFIAQQDVPEGVEDGAEAQAEATELAKEAFPTAVDVAAGNSETESGIIKAAVKLATTKARKSGTRSGGTGERRDLGAHISEAFDAVESGKFLTVAEIRKFESTGYGSDHPSAGAITNRLQPKSGAATTIDGITVEKRDGKLGAVKN